ncbi:MAG: FAD-dependent oxidoreductase [Planctomycetota bacterium]
MNVSSFQNTEKLLRKTLSMLEQRLKVHPILPILERKRIPFTFAGRALVGQEGEVISTALFANGIQVFGHHARDGAPQGIFCANGQCSQCLVLADGVPVKACMTPLREEMQIEPCEGNPALPPADRPVLVHPPRELAIDVLIVGGGPAGICAAIELGQRGVGVLMVDDKQELGGKLSLQTHAFFGSQADCFAGTRGIDIAKILGKELQRFGSVQVSLETTAVAVFKDRKVGCVQRGEYFLVSPRVLLIATGARERALAFEGCDLPGVYGAGAFQTLVNRDAVVPCRRLFIVGGGNVGLIAGYHALQAGIDVVGLVEALPQVGGYKVHADKLKRLGVPIWTRHTVLRAEGEGKVERVVIAAVDERFKPIAGTERRFEVDTLLVAVGLDPVDELLEAAKRFGMEVHAAGDAEEIAEASAAIFSGKITGRRIARSLGHAVSIPDAWEQTARVLKSRPGPESSFHPEGRGTVFPIIRCVQEIPCDPCMRNCPRGLIRNSGESIMDLPRYEGEEGECLGCGRCVAVCPGLAITLVDVGYDPERKRALVVVPFEMAHGTVEPGAEIEVADFDGASVGQARVLAVKWSASLDRRALLLLEVPYDAGLQVASVKIRQESDGVPARGEPACTGESIICRCNRVSEDEIVREIRRGERDINALKAMLKVCMGACGGKTCEALILRLFRQEGVDLRDVTAHVERPFLADVALSALAGAEEPRE